MVISLFFIHCNISVLNFTVKGLLTFTFMPDESEWLNFSQVRLTQRETLIHTHTNANTHFWVMN